MAFYASGTGQPVAELATKASAEFINSATERLDVLRSMQGRAGVGTPYSGTGGTTPVYDDMRGIVLETWWTNIITPLRTTIASLAPYFLRIHTDTEYAFFNLTTLLSDGSYGSSWVDSHRLQDSTVWLQMREALEALIWPGGYVDVRNTSTNAGKQKYASSSGEVSAEAAWDASRAQATSWVGAAYGSSAAFHLMQGVAGAYGATVSQYHQLQQSLTMPTPVLASTRLYYWHAFLEDFSGYTPQDPGPAMSDNHGQSSQPTGWSGSWQNNTVSETPAPTGNTTFTLTWDPVDHVWDPISTNATGRLYWAIGETMVPTGNLESLMTYG